MKYLFKALFNSGEIISQNHEDKSEITEGRNCFFDVLQRLNEVRAFALYNTETNEEWLVDLADGHFEHNLSSFVLHDEPLNNVRLIYFRRNEVNAMGSSVGSQKIKSFHFGFQYTAPNGANKQCVIALPG